MEAKRRRGELAMYVLPKGMESAWIMARGKGLVPRSGRGEVGEAVVSYCFMIFASSVDLVWVRRRTDADECFPSYPA